MFYCNCGAGDNYRLQTGETARREGILQFTHITKRTGENTMIYLIGAVALVIGFVLGFFLFALAYTSEKADRESEIARKNKRIESQTQVIFEMRKHLVEAKGIASSEELRADLLARMKDELQSDYDKLVIEWKELITDYKKLYLELDALKASEVRKFRTPEEIVTAMKLENDFDEVLKELSTIEEMLLEVKPKVLLAS